MSNGTGRYQPSVTMGWPRDVVSSAIQSRHASAAARMIETAAMARVVPSAMPSGHSRRTRNHNRPTPGVTFVSSGSAQVADQRKPATIAAAISRWTLPEMISNETAGTAATAARGGPAATTAARSSARSKRRRTVPRDERERRDRLGERRRIEVRADDAGMGRRVVVAGAGRPVRVRIVRCRPRARQRTAAGARRRRRGSGTRRAGAGRARRHPRRPVQRRTGPIVPHRQQPWGAVDGHPPARYFRTPSGLDPRARCV